MDDITLNETLLFLTLTYKCFRFSLKSVVWTYSTFDNKLERNKD